MIQPRIIRIYTSVEKKYISHQRWKNIGSNIVLPLITFSVGKYYRLGTVVNIGMSGARPLNNHVDMILDKPKGYEVKDENCFFYGEFRNIFLNNRFL